MRLLLHGLLASGLLAAQVPRIGVIDIYGLNRVSEERIRRLLGVSEGAPLPPSKAALEERLEELPQVVRARVEAVCCDGDRAILYVGIEEKGAPHFEFRYPPGEDIALPEPVVATYRKFIQAFEEAARRGETREDLTRGYPLSADAETRALQEKLRELAESNFEVVRRVLRNSAYDDQRAMAACIIGYAPRRRGVVDDLLYAMRDAATDVRANAMRALAAIGVLADREPDLELRIPPTWFIEMLNSIVWSDRYRAAAALVSLTEKRDAATLEQIRERALPSLVQMARWKTLAHALPAYILLGRIAGLPEDRIHELWESGRREEVIARFSGMNR